MSNKHLMIVELSPEHAIGLQNSPLARDALLIQGIKKAIVKLHSTEVDVIVLDFGTHGGPSQANSPRGRLSPADRGQPQRQDHRHRCHR